MNLEKGLLNILSEGNPSRTFRYKEGQSIGDIIASKD